VREDGDAGRRTFRHSLDHMENMVLRIAGLIGLFKTARVGNGLQSCSTFIVDQTGYQTPRFFVSGPERFVSCPRPTPAGRPRGRTLFCSCGPCLSAASWSALPLAAVPSDSAEQGASGFGSFCRNKRASAAGPRPGNTEHRLPPEGGIPVPGRHLPPIVDGHSPRWISETYRHAVMSKP
jgi:hypothetical protein